MHHRNSTSAVPRWVKAFATAAIVLVLLFVSLHLVGRGLGGHALHAGASQP